MTVKRTRAGTKEELAPPADAQPPQNQTKKGVDASKQVKFGEFLERCHYCKKRIPEEKEIFMYKDFCAFCSVGCRDIQISLDKLAEKQPASSKEKMVQCQKMKDEMSHCGVINRLKI